MVPEDPGPPGLTRMFLVLGWEEEEERRLVGLRGEGRRRSAISVWRPDGEGLEWSRGRLRRAQKWVWKQGVQVMFSEGSICIRYLQYVI